MPPKKPRPLPDPKYALKSMPTGAVMAYRCKKCKSQFDDMAYGCTTCRAVRKKFELIPEDEPDPKALLREAITYCRRQLHSAERERQEQMQNGNKLVPHVAATIRQFAAEARELAKRSEELEAKVAGKIISLSAAEQIQLAVEWILSLSTPQARRIINDGSVELNRRDKRNVAPANIPIPAKLEPYVEEPDGSADDREPN
jgi:predicted  nucleic acid-binding Zn-ribbon protein